jgi:hypothetical protein
MRHPNPLLLFAIASGAAGCLDFDQFLGHDGSGAAPADFARLATDASAPATDDLASPDLAALGDLQTPPDFAPDLDLADFALPLDSAPPPDFAAPDFALSPDFASIDFAAPDLVMPPDLQAPDGSAPALFASPLFSDTGCTANDVVIADWNGDKIPDVAIIGGTLQGQQVGGAVVFVNDGTGKLTQTALLPAGMNAGTVAAADWNGDQITDLAVGCGFPGTVTFFFGAGDGKGWNGPGPFMPRASSFVRALAAGDFNKDGKPDLAVSLSIEPGPGELIAVLPGNGNGTFAQTVFTNVSASQSHLIAANLDGDNALDLATSAIGAQAFGTLLGNGNGTFQPVTLYQVAGTEPGGVAVADLNGDNALDLVAVYNVNMQGTVLPLINTGNGTLKATMPITTPSHTSRAIAAADFDLDGLPDVVIGSDASDQLNAGNILLLSGAGGGRLSPATATTINVKTRALAAADLNGDGKSDLVVAYGDVGTGGVLVLLNQKH